MYFSNIVVCYFLKHPVHTQTIEGLWCQLKRFLRSKILNSIDLAIKIVKLINEL